MLNPFSSRRLPRRRATTQDAQYSEAWLLLGVIVLIVGVATGSGFLTAAAAVLLTVPGVAWLWSRFSLSGVTYQRALSEWRGYRGEVLTLSLGVRNRKALPLTWLSISDIFPSRLRVEGYDLAYNTASNQLEFRTFWMPGAFQRLSRTYAIECTERGFHRFGPASVSTGDGFGFFTRRTQLDNEQRVIVYPQLYSVAELKLPAKNPFGEQRARGTLYEDPLRTVGIRGWQETDAPRRIHWKATARHGELLSRLYEPSEEQQVLLFLNVATLARHWQGSIPELMERTISVAASLAALAAEQRVPVGLITNGAMTGSDQPLRLLPGRSSGQLMRILEMLAVVTEHATQPIEQALLHEAPRIPWGATVVVVTAIAHEPLLAALQDLAAAGRRVVLFTLAEEPPTRLLYNITVYHLPHLVDDLVAPNLV